MLSPTDVSVLARSVTERAIHSTLMTTLFVKSAQQQWEEEEEEELYVPLLKGVCVCVFERFSMGEETPLFSSSIIITTYVYDSSLSVNGAPLLCYKRLFYNITDRFLRLFVLSSVSVCLNNGAEWDFDISKPKGHVLTWNKIGFSLGAEVCVCVCGWQQ